MVTEKRPALTFPVAFFGVNKGRKLKQFDRRFLQKICHIRLFNIIFYYEIFKTREHKAVPHAMSWQCWRTNRMSRLCECSNHGA